MSPNFWGAAACFDNFDRVYSVIVITNRGRSSNERGMAWDVNGVESGISWGIAHLHVEKRTERERVREAVRQMCKIKWLY